MTDDKPKTRRTGQCIEVIPQQKYRIRIFLKRDSARRKHFHNETFNGTRKAAEKRVRELLRKRDAGEPLEVSADTFGTFLDAWLESKKLRVAESSLAMYTRFTDMYIRPHLGGLLLTEVTAEKIQAAYSKLHADGLSAPTIRSVHSILSMAFKLAVRRKLLQGSPMAGVELPKDADDGEEVERSMTAEQVAAFLAAAEAECSRMKNLFAVAFRLGCRPGELLALRTPDFNATSGTLRIGHSVVFRKEGDWYLRKTKNKQSRRVLPITAPAIEALRAERTAQLERRLKAGAEWVENGFIFCGDHGEPFSQATLRREFRRVLKAAGLPGHFSPYSARHSHATILISDGVPIKAVSERLGHSRINTTLSFYAHVMPGHQEAVSERYDDLLKGKKR